MVEFTVNNPRYKIGNSVTLLRHPTSEEEDEFSGGRCGRNKEIGTKLIIEKNSFQQVYPTDDIYKNIIRCDGWWYSISAFEEPSILRKKYKKFLPKEPKWKKCWKNV